MGDERAQSPNESTEQMLQAYANHFPELMKINAANILPTEQAKLAATQAVSPGYTALQQQLYDAYGPLMGDTANRIAAAQGASTAKSDLDIVKGTGRDLVKEALQTQRLADPEYFAGREKVGGRLSDLLGSIDLTGNINRGESEEMIRAQNRENDKRGIANNPSQTAALSNALTFGQAKHQRQNEAKGQLTNALSVGNQFLPASQSGIDVFKVATGKTSMPNAGDSKFLGVQNGIGSDTMNTGNQFLNNIGQLTGQQNDINANRRDVLDRMNETGQALGSLS